MTSDTFPSRPFWRRYLPHLAVWTAAWLIHAGAFAYFMPFAQSLARSLGNLGLMALLFYGNLFLMRRLLEQRRYLWYGAALPALFLLLMGLRTRLNLLFELPFDPTRFLRDPVDNWRFGALMTNIGILLISALYESFRLRFRDERQADELIHRQNEAQLQLLRSQINPHFLFNTLNNIYSLAVLRSEKTAPMVLRLSQLLRYVVYEAREEKIPLEREIEQLREYIDLFQMRSETPVDIRLSVTGSFADHAIEPMLLLPIVENGLKHTDFADNPQAFFQLDIDVSDHILSVNSLNTFNPDDRQQDRVGGVGLENIRRRLALRYADRYRLDTAVEGRAFRLHLFLQLPRCCALLVVGHSVLV